MKKTVYISNLSYDRNEAGLKILFAKFGSVKKIKIVVDPKTERSKGMAFVEMGTETEAKNAIQGLNGKIVDGRTIKAKYATPLKSSPRDSSLAKGPKVNKAAPELDFKAKQLAKKARNDARRKSNPLVFKKSSR